MIGKEDFQTGDLVTIDDNNGIFQIESVQDYHIETICMIGETVKNKISYDNKNLFNTYRKGVRYSFTYFYDIKKIQKAIRV